MNYITVSGTASHVRRMSESTEFRVGRQPIIITDVPHLGDGDSVSIVGSEKKGKIHALVMRNDTTGEVSQRRVPQELVVAATPALIFGGLSACAILLFGRFGLMFLPFIFPAAGTLLLYGYKRGQVVAAFEILRQVPAASPSP